MKMIKGTKAAPVVREWHIAEFDYKNSFLRMILTGRKRRKCAVFFPASITNQEQAERKAREALQQLGYMPEHCYNIIISLWR